MKPQTLTSPLNLPDIPSKRNGMLIIIDPSIPQAEMLINGVVEGAKVLVLHPQQDAIAQISEYLHNKQGFNSLHLITHGAPASLSIGTTKLTLENLTQFAPQLRQWKQAFSPNFELLLYGCQVTKTAQGKQFVKKLSQITGATVAASSTLTGNAALEGNWDLDYTTGEINSASPFLLDIQAQYPGVLATFTVNAGDVSNTGSGFTGGLVWAINQANATAGDDIIQLSTGSTFSLTSAIDFDPGTSAIDGHPSWGFTGLPIITDKVTIESTDPGPSGTQVTIERSSSASDFRLLLVSPGVEVELNNLILQNGRATSGFLALGDDGGGILNVGGKLTINNSQINNNVASDDGGGILNVGDGSSKAELTINDSTISNNTAQAFNTGDGGGGIENDGNFDSGGLGASATINNSTITGNVTTNGSGGGIRSRDGAELTINNTTVEQNSAPFGSGVAIGDPTENDQPTTFTVQNNTKIIGNATETNGSGAGQDVEVSSTTPIDHTINITGNNAIGTNNSNDLVGVPWIELTRQDNNAEILNSGTVNLGSLVVGSNAVTTTFTITNTIEEDLDLTGFNISGSSLFTVSPTSLPASVTGGNSTTFNVTFNPSAIGPQTATVSFNTNGFNITDNPDSNVTSPFSFSLQATVSETPPTPPPPPVPPSPLQVDSSNVFTVGNIDGSNIFVQLSESNVTTFNTLQLVNLSANTTFDLFTTMPGLFRPNGFTASEQQSIFSGLQIGDRFAIQINGQTSSTQDLRVTDLGSGNFSLGFETGSDSSFDDVVVNIASTTAPTPTGGGTNQTIDQEIIDLQGIEGTVQATFTLYREAAFANTVGLYRLDSADGTVNGIAPGEEGYAEAAISNRVENLNLQVANQSSVQDTVSLVGGSFYGLFLIANTTPEIFLQNNPENTAGGGTKAYFAFLGANPDGVDHLQLLGDNLFGFEDLPNGGDRDYNDMIIQVDIA